MPWFIYYNDTLILVEIRAFTIDETVRLGIARDVLGSVDRYCLYEGGNEVVIEYWRGSNTTTFNKTLGLESPLIVGSYGLYVNLVAIITDAVLVAIAYLVLARGKPRTGLVRYSLGIVAVYAILSAALYLVITTEPAYTCTSMPTNLDSIATFTASIVIGSVTPLVYVYKKRWRVGSDWKPLLFTLYASIIAGSLIIDTTTALALRSIPRPASACTGSVIIGAHGPIDGLVTAPPLGLLAGYIIMNTIMNSNKDKKH
jgi:hypothetical protein